MKHDTLQGLGGGRMRAGFPGRAFLVLGLCAGIFAAGPATAQTDVFWTGNASGSWTNTGNWQGGELPGSGNRVVFAVEEAGNLGSINFPSDNYAVHGFLFNNANNGAAVNITGSLTSTQYLTLGVNGGIKVDAGVGDVRISLGNQNAQYRMARTGTTSIENWSSSTLRIHGVLIRDDTSGSDPKVSVKGTGDIVIERGLGASSGEWTLDADFTGRLISSLAVGTNQAVIVNGGTLRLVQGFSARDNNSLIVNNGVLEGGGLFGGTTVVTRILTINFNNGAIVAPGRVGTTGTMTFTNSEVPFSAGSTLRLDLLDKDDHDKIAFTSTGGYQNAWLTLDTTGAGASLDLNFLPGFSADVGDVFVIMDGYESLTGAFAGLPDKHEWEEGGYSFRIDYGESATTMTVIPEPGALGLLLGSGMLLALRRRAALRG